VSQQAPGSDASLATEWQALEDDRARLQADIHAATWRIHQLLSMVEKGQDAEEQVSLLKHQLSHAESRLNEQAALLHQLESTAIRG
jgi:chromosome segregation ATPase